jgi:ubiquitin-protein ligase
MLSTPRWTAEQRMMQNAFPQFQPYIDRKHFGFNGHLHGQSGRIYQVEIRAEVASYPAREPKIFITPRCGHNYYTDGRLCVHRRWRPDRDTLAQQVLYAAKYVQEKG